jgi:hypothetical protein
MLKKLEFITIIGEVNTFWGKQRPERKGRKKNTPLCEGLLKTYPISFHGKSSSAHI